MKTLKTLFLALCASALFVACGGGGAETVAKDFHAAMSKSDFEGAKKFCGPEYVTLIDQMIEAYKANPEIEKMGKEMAAKTKTTFVSCVEDEKAGTAVATFNIEVDGQKTEQKLNLKKIENVWKVVPNV